MLYLFLNSISTGEVIIILVFILMFFGSKSIPGMAKTFGRTLRQIRDATDDIKRDIRKSTSEIEKEFKDIQNDVTSSSKSITDTFKNQTKELGEMSEKFKTTLESAGTEKLSNKRRPITQKFVSEEELTQGEENKTSQVDSEKSEKTDPVNTENHKSSVSDTKVNKQASGNNKKTKVIKPREVEKSDHIKPVPDKDNQTEKDPES